MAEGATFVAVGEEDGFAAAEYFDGGEAEECLGSAGVKSDASGGRGDDDGIGAGDEEELEEVGVGEDGEEVGAPGWGCVALCHR